MYYELDRVACIWINVSETMLVYFTTIDGVILRMAHCPRHVCNILSFKTFTFPPTKKYKTEHVNTSATTTCSLNNRNSNKEQTRAHCAEANKYKITSSLITRNVSYRSCGYDIYWSLCNIILLLVVRVSEGFVIAWHMKCIDELSRTICLHAGFARGISSVHNNVTHKSRTWFRVIYVYGRNSRLYNRMLLLLYIVRTALGPDYMCWFLLV